MRGGRLCWSSTPFFVFLCFIVLVVLVEGVVGIVEVPEKKQKPVWYDRGIFSFLSPLFSGPKSSPNKEAQTTRAVVMPNRSSILSLRITRPKLRTEVYMENSKYPFRVAVCYWGLTRTLETVYPNHVSNLYDPLSKSKIDYDIFIHKWFSSQGNEFVWSSSSSPSSRDDWSILKPFQVKVEDQDEFREHGLNFSRYYYPGEDAKATPGDWNKRLLLNHMLALESLKRVTLMVLNSNQYYDGIIFIRPDCTLNAPLPIKKLRELSSETIIIPDEEHFLGFNDRFAMGRFAPMILYGTRIKELEAYRKSCGRIISERFLKFYLDKHKITVIPDGDISISLVRPSQRVPKKIDAEVRQDKGETMGEQRGSEGGESRRREGSKEGGRHAEDREKRIKRWEARKEDQRIGLHLRG